MPMGKQIAIDIKDKVAILADKEQFLVCGNNDYEVVFNFDSDWDGINVKTALFVFGDNPIAVPFEGNTCEGVAIENSTICAIGVFAGDLKTSTGASIRCIPSVRDMGGVPTPPTPEVYDKIMEMLDKAMQAHTELPTGGKKGQVLSKKSDEDYETEWVDIEVEGNTEEIGYYDTIISDVSVTSFSDQLASAKGRVLVKGITVTGEITVPEAVTLIEFSDCIYGSFTIEGNSRCTIRGIDTTDSPNYDSITIFNFGAVEHCISGKAYIYVNNCERVLHCSLSEIKNSNFISDCSIVAEMVNGSISGCHNINNVYTDAEFSMNTIEFTNCHIILNVKGNKLDFVNCSHISNVTAETVTYANCTYVDPFTCKEFVSIWDDGKAIAVTYDGRFVTLQSAEEVSF